MAPVTLDWSTAEVKNSKLTVPLDGDIPKGWRKAFAATVRLLASGEWGEIQVKRDTVRVSDVEPGSEDKLRHHLEAVVQQANAEHEPDEDEEDAAPDAVQSGPGAGDEDEGPDAEMTRRFRSF
jgi:hypothetical protein